MGNADIQHLLQQLSGIAQNHITAEELEIVAIVCLGIITQQAAADIADNVHWDTLIQHANLQIHMFLLQHVQHININARAMT
jgi:hypothetical protein